MRIGCLQFAPVRGDVTYNMTRADKILRKVNKEKPQDFQYDLLVLPEMAFAGSKFGPAMNIGPFLEPAGAGATSLWALTAARHHHCAVAVGYPQKPNLTSGETAGVEYFSSLIMVDAEGETLAHNTGRSPDGRDQKFSDCIVPGACKVSMGLFTDLGKEEFSNPSETEAFASHMLANDSYIGIVSMAWETREERAQFSRQKEEPDVEALSCWVTRLEPLIRAKRQKETFIILCNRSGLQDDATYAGTSAVLGIKDGLVLVYGVLGGGISEMLVVDTSSGPFDILTPLRSNKEDFSGSLANVSPIGAAASQAEPRTPDTPYPQFFPAQESLQKHIFCDNGMSRKQNTFPGAGIYPFAMTQGPPVAAKKKARPRLLIPESPSKLPQKMLAGRSRVLEAAALESSAATSNVRSPTASTPYPNGSHSHWGRQHMIERYTSRPFRPLAPVTPITPFDDPMTAISPSVQCWNRQSSPFTPDRGSPCSTGQSSAADTMASDPNSPPRRDAIVLNRPKSPKSFNVEIPVSAELHSGEADCGTIPILASPSLIGTDSQTEQSSSERRGRRRERKQPSEEDSRSSSRDSTRNAVLHRSVWRSDSHVRHVADQQSQSTSSRRPRNFSQSSTLPAV